MRVFGTRCAALALAAGMALLHACASTDKVFSVKGVTAACQLSGALKQAAAFIVEAAREASELVVREERRAADTVLRARTLREATGDAEVRKICEAVEAYAQGILLGGSPLSAARRQATAMAANARQQSAEASRAAGQIDSFVQTLATFAPGTGTRKSCIGEEASEEPGSAATAAPWSDKWAAETTAVADCFATTKQGSADAVAELDTAAKAVPQLILDTAEGQLGTAQLGNNNHAGCSLFASSSNGQNAPWKQAGSAPVSGTFGGMRTVDKTNIGSKLSLKTDFLKGAKTLDDTKALPKLIKKMQSTMDVYNGSTRGDETIQQHLTKARKALGDKFTVAGKEDLGKHSCEEWLARASTIQRALNTQNTTDEGPESEGTATDHNEHQRREAATRPPAEQKRQTAKGTTHAHDIAWPAALAAPAAHLALAALTDLA
ncbi:hypothetical protein, conserved in T. vivax [Trypanosoma vivax Y486]|uniref:Uncharacterized protein n=1 Tax=Trypanosoma vivax (strain Y486) TaxID=1055687 RepID=F9WUC0_TRYVY|nr:hypothetical protein, conserved in T. vivax [Trypanosoma vivax Y486]|eukprot:CCD21168.1 hypothetical protein, conserved in T. vivax [Trypanosoma vivax Y486]